MDLVSAEHLLTEIRTLFENKIERLEKYIHNENQRLESKIDTLTEQHNNTRDKVLLHQQKLATLTETDKEQRLEIESLKTKAIKVETQLHTKEQSAGNTKDWVQWVVVLLWGIVVFVTTRFI